MVATESNSFHSSNLLCTYYVWSFLIKTHGGASLIYSVNLNIFVYFVWWFYMNYLCKVFSKKGLVPTFLKWKVSGMRSNHLSFECINCERKVTLTKSFLGPLEPRACSQKLKSLTRIWLHCTVGQCRKESKVRKYWSRDVTILQSWFISYNWFR